jgi:iron complex outermembrane receptor protein
MSYFAMPSRRRFLRTGAALLAILHASAQAQTSNATPAPAAPADETIVLSPFEVRANQDDGYRASNSVSATRMAIELSKVPMAINAFTQEFIDDQKARDLIDIVRFAPGVVDVNAEFNAGPSQFGIRGFDTITTLRNGFIGPTVVDAGNIARVEVVKGPASMLYGQISPGGIVNYITKRPESRNFGSVMQAIGTDNYYRTDVDVNFGSTSSPLDFRLTAAYDHAPELFEPSERVAYSFNPSLTWKIAQKTKITFEYENLQVDENPMVLPAQFYIGVFPVTQPNGTVVNQTQNIGLINGLVPWSFNPTTTLDRRESDTQAWVIDAQTEFLGWVVRAAYSHNEQTVNQMLTASIIGTPPATPTIGRRGRRQINSLQDDTYQIEATHRYDLEVGTINVLLGAQYGETNPDFYTTQLPGALAGPAWNLQDPATWIRTPPFTESQFVLNTISHIEGSRDGFYGIVHGSFLKDKLHALAGVRRSSLESHTYNDITHTETTAAAQSAEETTPQFGVLVQPVKQVGIFASYSESFNPIGGARVTRGVPVGPYDPVVGEGIDVGFKFSFFDGKLSANVGYFDVTNSGTIIESQEIDPATGAAVRTTTQSGEDRSQGYEFDMLWTPTKEWSVYASWAKLDSWIVKNNDVNVVGRQRQNTVNDTWNIWIKRSFGDFGLPGFSLAGGVSYIGERRISAAQQGRYYPDAHLVDLLASYTWGKTRYRYTVDVGVKNALNEEYVRSSSASKADTRRINASFRLRF